MAIKDEINSLFNQIVDVYYNFDGGDISIGIIKDKSYFNYSDPSGIEYTKIIRVDGDCFETRRYLLANDKEIPLSKNIYSINHVSEIRQYRLKLIR